MRIASINSISCSKPNLSKRANLREAEQPQIQTTIEPSFKGNKPNAVQIGAAAGATLGLLVGGIFGAVALGLVGLCMGGNIEDVNDEIKKEEQEQQEQNNDQNKQIGNNDQK